MELPADETSAIAWRTGDQRVPFMSPHGWFVATENTGRRAAVRR